MKELEIQDAIRLELGDTTKYPDIVLWRNSVGTLTDRTGRHVRFGLSNGSADLVGMFTCSDGRALWVEAEIKTAKGKQDEAQVLRQHLVTARGGDYTILRSVDDARAWVAGLRRKYK